MPLGHAGLHLLVCVRIYFLLSDQDGEFPFISLGNFLLASYVVKMASQLKELFIQGWTIMHKYCIYCNLFLSIFLLLWLWLILLYQESYALLINLLGTCNFRFRDYMLSFSTSSSAMWTFIPKPHSSVER